MCMPSHDTDPTWPSRQESGQEAPPNMTIAFEPEVDYVSAWVWIHQTYNLTHKEHSTIQQESSAGSLYRFQQIMSSAGRKALQFQCESSLILEIRLLL